MNSDSHARQKRVVKLIGIVVFSVEISDSHRYIIDFQHIMSIIISY